MSKNVLTEADKKRVEEEERYRAKVREGLNQAPKNKGQKPKKRGKGCLTFIAALIVLGAIGGFIPLLVITMTGEPTSRPVKQRDFKDFKAVLTFTGTQFVITSVDNLDCQNARMTVNNDYAFEGYTLEAGKVYTLGALQFAKKDGTRFDPFKIKPMSFSIWCRGNNALKGAIYVGEFE